MLAVEVEVVAKCGGSAGVDEVPIEGVTKIGGCDEVSLGIVTE